jgi:hypothetical protein
MRQFWWNFFMRRTRTAVSLLVLLVFSALKTAVAQSDPVGVLREMNPAVE